MFETHIGNNVVRMINYYIVVCSIFFTKETFRISHTNIISYCVVYKINLQNGIENEFLGEHDQIPSYSFL